MGTRAGLLVFSQGPEKQAAPSDNLSGKALGSEHPVLSDTARVRRPCRFKGSRSLMRSSGQERPVMLQKQTGPRLGHKPTTHFLPHSWTGRGLCQDPGDGQAALELYQMALKASTWNGPSLLPTFHGPRQVRAALNWEEGDTIPPAGSIWGEALMTLTIPCFTDGKLRLRHVEQNPPRQVGGWTRAPRP